MASYALLNTRVRAHVKVILSSAIQLDALGKQPNWVKWCRSFLFRICLYRFQFSSSTYPDRSQAGGKPQLAIPSKEVCKRRGKRGQRDPLSQVFRRFRREVRRTHSFLPSYLWYKTGDEHSERRCHVLCFGVAHVCACSVSPIIWTLDFFFLNKWKGIRER